MSLNMVTILFACAYIAQISVSSQETTFLFKKIGTTAMQESTAFLTIDLQLQKVYESFSLLNSFANIVIRHSTNSDKTLRTKYRVAQIQSKLENLNVMLDLTFATNNASANSHELFDQALIPQSNYDQAPVTSSYDQAPVISSYDQAPVPSHVHDQTNPTHPEREVKKSVAKTSRQGKSVKR